MKNKNEKTEEVVFKRKLSSIGAGSLYITIPKVVARLKNWNVGDYVDVIITEDGFVVKVKKETINRR